MIVKRYIKCQTIEQLYEYGNLKHAMEHYNNEKSAQLLEYKDGEYYLMDAK